MSAPIGKSPASPARPETKHPESHRTPRGEMPRDFRRALGPREPKARALAHPSACAHSPAAPLHRIEPGERPAPRELDAPTHREADDEGGPIEVIEERAETWEGSLAFVANGELAPFRVNPALQPVRAAVPEATRTDQLASLVSAELVESLRVGRFGRDGHAVSMRVRTPSGVIGVELRQEDGALEMSLDGASPAELQALRTRVQRVLRERGIDLDVS